MKRERERAMSIERKTATENNRVEFRIELQKEKCQGNGGTGMAQCRRTDKKKDKQNKGQRKILREMRETMLETKLYEQSWNPRNRKEKEVASERE